MSEENRQQQSSAESTVAGAAKTGKAIASIAKGAATGGAHGAAVEAAKSSKKWIIPIVAVILLPVLIIAMLPSVIFGSLFGDGTDTPNGISDDTVLVQNLADINSGISMILSEGLNDVLARIDSDFAASGCDSKEVNNPFGSDVVFNANAIVSQYCAYKDTDATSISKDDIPVLQRPGLVLEEAPKPVIVGRCINGVTINGLEYLQNDDGEVLYFKGITAAKDYLREHEVTDEEMEDIVLRESVGTCIRCGDPLFPSDISGYAYQCFKCDEDFYAFEQGRNS